MVCSFPKWLCSYTALKMHSTSIKNLLRVLNIKKYIKNILIGSNIFKILNPWKYHILNILSGWYRPLV
jgi:hypothetical protein